MKPEHVTEFLERYEANPLEGMGIILNLRGRKKPLEGLTVEQVRTYEEPEIVALSAIYAPRVAFPPGARVTKTGVFFPSHAAGLEYLLGAIEAETLRFRDIKNARKLAPELVRKVGKSWRICSSVDGGRYPLRI